MPSPLSRLRQLCLTLPEADEVVASGEPTFRVRKKRFAMWAGANSLPSGGRPAVWCKAAPGNQARMVRAEPDRFFVPPSVGSSGWVGVWLDRNPDWDAVAVLMRDSYRLVAPRTLLALLEE